MAIADKVLEADDLRDGDDCSVNARSYKSVTAQSTKPIPLQTARWRAAQKAKRRGLPIRGTARELGIYRDSVRKYMGAESAPKTRSRTTPRVL